MMNKGASITDAALADLWATGHSLSGKTIRTILLLVSRIQHNPPQEAQRHSLLVSIYLASPTITSYTVGPRYHDFQDSSARYLDSMRDDRNSCCEFHNFWSRHPDWLEGCCRLQRIRKK